MTQELPPAPDSKPKIIDSVPGVAPRPVDAGGPVPARHGEVISIPAEEFKGDPSKVMGHPSNPYNNMDVSNLFPTTSTQEGIPTTTTPVTTEVLPPPPPPVVLSPPPEAR